METATQKKKAAGLNKGKLKKTIKNVLCRPDPLFWPVIPEDSEKLLSVALSKYKIKIPEFKKPHWKDLKQIPKEKRPKPAKLEKPEGFIFGVQECSEAIKNNDCAAILIEPEVNPRLIVQPVIEAATAAKLPVVCLNHLRKLTCVNFGIRTICLGVKKDWLGEFSTKINEIASKIKSKRIVEETKRSTKIDDTEPRKIEILEKIEQIPKVTNYLLYRTGKKSRVFIPNSDNKIKENKRKFAGQDFIEFTEKTKSTNQEQGTYMNMTVKRITNNPNRVKAGKKRKN